MKLKLETIKKLLPLLSIILKAKITGNNIPIRLDFNITSRCNLKCLYCYVEYSNQKKEELTLSQITRIIDDWYELGTRWLRLMGGEPLLRNDIDSIIAHSKKKGIFTEIITNGLLLDKKLDQIENIDSICISIDGNEKAHDFLRGKGSYQKAIKGLESCLQHSLPVKIHAVLSPYSMSTLQDFATLAQKYNVLFSYDVYMPLLDDFDGNNLVPQNSDVFEFFRQVRSIKSKGFPYSNSFTALDEFLEWPHGEKKIVFKTELTKARNIHCDNGFYSCYFDTDGGVYACPTLWNRGLNYFDVGAEEAWNYLRDTIPCYECPISPKDFSSVFKLNIFALREHISRVLFRGY